MPSNNSGGDEIHVMPKADFKQTKTTSPVRPAAPTSPTSPVGPTEPADGGPKEGGRSWTKIVLGIFIIALVAASAYFLYSSYKPAEPDEPVQPAAETEEVATAEAVSLPSTTPETESTETETATEDESPESATADVIPEIVSGSREEFDYGKFSELDLDMISSQDSDDDGLTDREERLFNTELGNFDTDGDNFSDGSELVNLYDPHSTESSLIKDSDLVKTYSNDNYKYTVLYPASWFAKSTDKSNLEVVFTSENNEFISVWVEENAEELTLKEWYKKQAPNVEADQLVEFINKKGVVGVKSPDGFTVYFQRDDFVYIMHYNIGLKAEADYPSVYKMMIESFNFILNQKG